MKRSALKVAEESVVEGNATIKKGLQQQPMCREAMQQGQAMMEMGLKRKEVLESEISQLEIKKAKLLK